MVWANCLNTLRAELPEQDFLLWIRPLVDKIQDNELLLTAPNPHFVKHITKHYLPRIQQLVDQLTPDAPLKVSLNTNTIGTSIVKPPPADHLNDVLPEMTILPNNATKPKRTSRSSIKRALNQNFTFESFVEGKSNQMAAQTCRRVLDSLGEKSHNPLYIWGPSGLGKTHLMQAVGNQLMVSKPNSRVVYLTADQFTSSFTGSLKDKTIEEFKRELRSLDLLLVDDIHFLAGKKATAEEFFNTFNSLMDDGKQIILTSDRYPKELTELDPRLVSRFSWGLAVAIEPPDLTTRIGILLKKAQNPIFKAQLSENAALFIAQHVMGNVRELEGSLNKVMAAAEFKKCPIDVDLIKDALKDVIAIRARTVSVDNIKKTVADYFGIPVKEIIGAKRTRVLARPRQIAMGLSRELTNQSFPEIGLAFGGRDHTTVMHAVEKVKTLCETDVRFAEDYQNLLRLLQF